MEENASVTHTNQHRPEFLRKDSAKAANASEEDAMHYMLTLHNAKDQAYVPLTDESMMKKVEAYYSKHGHTNERTLARYLLAACYRDQNLYMESQHWANLAEEGADTTATDFNFDLLYKVCALRAQTFAFRVSKEVYLEDFQRAAYYAQKAGEGLKVAEANCRVALTYFNMGKFDKARREYENCIRSYTTLGYGQTPYVSACILKMAEIEIARKDVRTADSLMAVFERRERGNLESDAYLMKNGLFSYLAHKSDLCVLKQNYPMALACTRRQLRLGGNFPGWASLELSDIFSKMGKSDSAYHYLKRFVAFNDSMQENIKAVELQASQHRFNAMQSEKKIEEADKRTAWSITISALLFVGIMLVSAAYFIHNRRRQALMLQTQKEYNEAKAQIEALKQLKKAQEETGFVTETNGKDLETAIEESEKKVEELHRKMPRLAETERLVQKIAEAPATVNIVRKAEMGLKVEEADLERLYQTIGEMVPGIHATLGQALAKKAISQSTFYTCLLVVAQVKVGKIAKILCKSQSTISVNKSRANLALFHEKSGNSLEWNLLFSNM